MNPAPEIRKPDGSVVTGRPPEADENLADWLEDLGILLNTRCGKRGLCQGCRVKTDNGESIAACQNKASAYAGQTLHLPPSSLRDATLTGVTAFELDDAVHGPFALPDGPGLALDIGTTTLAGALWTGEPPRCAALTTRANPQIRFGDNVVSRVQAAMDHGVEDLQKALCNDGLKPLIHTLLEQGGLEASDIQSVTVAGNPVMLHTLAGDPLAGFAAYPFHPAFLKERVLPGEEVGLTCRMRLLPAPGPFVGSDVLGGALANGFFDRDGIRLLIDFGTNGEILLRDGQGRTWCTATAAGPAFEGGRLRCGAAAGPGVIGRLAREETDTWELPESGMPWRALAGAAYVDFMALGRQQGWLDAMGRFTSTGQEKGKITADVEVTETDLAELVLAKAAIQAGWTTLLECAGVAAEDLDAVVIAGGFGYHLNPEHARIIGLLPDIDSTKIQLVGNASLAGASLALLQPNGSRSWREHCEDMEVVELNQTDSFEDHYLDAMTVETAE